MKNSSHVTQLLAPTLVGIAAGLGIFFFSEPKSSPDPSVDSSQGGTAVSRKSDLEQRRSEASGALLLAENGDAQKMDEFVSKWLSLHSEDQDFILGQLSEWYYTDDEKYHDFVRDFTLQVFSQDRPRGLEVVSMFPRREGIRNLERNVLNQWAFLDQDELLAALTQRADESLAIYSSHLHQLASIYGNEQVDKFNDYLSWINGLDQKNSGLSDLQRGAYEGLSVHCPAEHRAELYATLMEQVDTNHRLRDFPANLVGAHAIENPERICRLA